MNELRDTIKVIHDEFEDIAPVLDERRIRLWCAARARAYNRVYGRGGGMVLHKATGVSRPRISAGMGELEAGCRLAKGRSRCSGGGRKKNT